MGKNSLAILFLITYSCLPCQAQNGVSHDSTSSTTTKPDSSSTKEKLKEFKDAFNKLVKNDKPREKPKQDPTLQLGILVLDRTRTKMGRDFYSLFYQNWQPPVDNQNFTITINEKPSPGLGSIVSINIDNNMVYQTRLQPRYEDIKKASSQAVNRCRRIIQRKASVRQQLSGF